MGPYLDGARRRRPTLGRRRDLRPDRPQSGPSDPAAGPGHAQLGHRHRPLRDAVLVQLDRRDHVPHGHRRPCRDPAQQCRVEHDSGLRLLVHGSATADTQQLKVWVSSHHGTGQLTASINGTTFSDTTGGVSGGQNQGGVYTLDFTGSGTPGETMTVSYALTSVANPGTLDSSGLPSTEANAVVYGAALRTTVTPAPAPVLIRAATGTTGGILGRLEGGQASGTTDVTFFHATSCAPVVLAAGRAIGTVSVTLDAAARGRSQSTSRACPPAAS